MSSDLWAAKLLLRMSVAEKLKRRIYSFYLDMIVGGMGEQVLVYVCTCMCVSPFVIILFYFSAIPYICHYDSTFSLIPMSLLD